MSTFRAALDVLLAVGLLAVGTLMLLPGGPANEWARDRYRAFEARQALERHWGELASGGSVLGNPDNIVVVVFTDYECPFCRASEPTLQDYIRTFDSIGVMVRHLPLTQLHPSAEWAARVAVCAEQQGVFPKVHEALMSSEAWREEPDLTNLPAAVDVPDEGALERCLAAESTTERIAADAGWARQFGLTGTPSFVTVDGIQSGAITDVEELQQFASAN